MTLDDLAAMSLPALEALYTGRPCGELPGGRWRGTYLAELPMSLPKRLLARAMFRAPRFGLDLDAHSWWFQPGMSDVGRFRPTRGPSRWRDTETYRLTYESPRGVRRMLYDELKPLDASLILGLGGSNHDAPAGTWFYFALTPASP